MRRTLQHGFRALLALLLVLAGLTVGAPAISSGNPGGMSRFVVSIGNLPAGNENVWVRLGAYSFTASQGAVTASFYVWEKDAPSARIGTGTTSIGCGDVPTCEVRTAAGFTGSPTESRSGTFTNNGSLIRIDWENGWWEEWDVRVAADDSLAQLVWRDSNYATKGTAYGSNATFQTRRAMSTVANSGLSLPYRGTTWHDGEVKTFKQGFDTTKYSICTTATWCMTARQEISSACSCSTAPSTAINYYVVRVGSTDRRDTWEHWCQCLADGRGETCYTGNSHTKPLMQIIDENNAWRGWVGVEVFYNQTGSDPHHGYFSTFAAAPTL